MVIGGMVGVDGAGLTQAQEILLNGAIQSTEKGANNGVGTLGNDGFITLSQLPRFQHSFTNTTTINITHNRGFIPQVTILNDNNQDITSGVAIIHNDNNSFIVMTQIAITGTINF